MEVVSSESIKIPNSVLVSGLTNTELDAELIQYLKTYGSIDRIVPIDDIQSPFHGHVIYEFTSGASMASLTPLLPITYESPSREDVKYHLRALASVYTPAASSSATSTYLEELQAIAKLSGEPFEILLQRELAKLTTRSTAPPVCSEEDRASSDLVSTTVVSPRSSAEQHNTYNLTSVTPPAEISQLRAAQIQFQNLTNENTSPARPPVETKTSPYPTISDVNPPDVQRVVVEHVVRSQEAMSHHHASLRLRAFSGRSPRPASEVDYDTWRTNVELIMSDPAISDLHRSRRIIDSLLPPATEVTKHLGSQASPAAYLELLDSAYGAVEDGDELFAKFMATFQDSGEKPSSYLHRLQTVLSTSVRRGGVPASELNRHLLKQFCRGCWDDALLTDLQLEQRKNTPPSFAELLLLLRTEEDRQAAKVTRMKQHLGASKQRARSHLQTACVYADSSETEQLKKQVAELQTQLTNLKTKKQKKTKSANSKVATDKQLTTKEKSQKHVKQPNSSYKPNKPRPWYCFHCGEDGHIATMCESEPNPSLVAAKKKQLREKQLQWEAQNASSDEDPLKD